MSKVGYTSEVMNFIKKYKSQHLKMVQESVVLRTTWWDKKEEDVAQSTQLRQDNVRPFSYAYFSATSNNK